jgi:hypothetical protein
MTTLWAIAVSLSLMGMASTAQDDAPDTIVVRGERMRVWPIDNLIARGFDLKRIPQSENAAWVYLEAINAYVELPGAVEPAFDHAVETGWPVDDDALRAYLDQPGNIEAIRALRQAAAMERCQLPYFGDATQSVIAVLLPNLSHMRFLAKLAVADGRRSESDGRHAAAVDHYFTLMRMAGHVSQGTTLIEGLVGVAIWRLGDRALRDMVLRAPLSADELRATARRLDESARVAPTVQRGLASERVFGMSIVDELCSRPLHLLRAAPGAFPSGSDGSDFFIGGPVNPAPDDGWGRLEMRIGKLILPDRAIKKHMLGFYDAVLDQAGRPPGADMAFDEERYLREEVPRWDVITRTMLPSLSRSVALGHRAEADHALTRLAVALRSHMADHGGTPPDTLAELEPLLPDDAGRDPFTGGPLIYRVEGEGWVVYSVGLNLADDDGVAGARWDEMDIVCRYPPDPIEAPEDGMNR